MPNFLRSTSLLHKILPTNLGVCKPTFYTFYTSHQRSKSTIRPCIYHTDLEQNAVFHSFQDKLHSINIQDDQSLNRGIWVFSGHLPSREVHGKSEPHDVHMVMCMSKCCCLYLNSYCVYFILLFLLNLLPTGRHRVNNTHNEETLLRIEIFFS